MRAQAMNQSGITISARSREVVVDWLLLLASTIPQISFAQQQTTSQGEN